ncbi:MAG: KTSC domain-containing protein [Xenococcaceae cyanobacterium]
MLRVSSHYDCYFVNTTNSSAIASLGFYFETDEDGCVVSKEYGTLFIYFGSGLNYYYQDVCVSTFFTMVNSPSLGRFFNKRILGNYRVESH